ncbi:hypothetical protein QQS21_002053 [Conoideocrella luteorostrata]|uniref:Uncharacterized protein n=1 Tax=Conoideocrella luteorostrata TaxID=1105319 RepID=A0AAJ0CZW6_9HYPO|nr:hypothetical protein QQS21_002053 [Conoideocrella luteorostrata]
MSPQVYYLRFATTQELSQLDLAREAGKILHRHGPIPTSEPKSFSVEAVGEMRGGSSWDLTGVYT